jgi:aminopeptidase N
MKQWIRWPGLPGLLSVMAFAFAILQAQAQPLVQAQAPFSFAKNPGKLPKSVIPQEYSLLLQPDLDKHGFSAELDVSLSVMQPVRQIVMNANELTIKSATLFDAEGAAQALTPRLNAEQETLTFALPKAIPPGNYRLFIAYRGKISRQPYGLYYDYYPTPSGDKQILATEMEPTEARRLLPCWDEPAFRASFKLSIDLPPKLKVFSNTGVAEQTLLPGGVLQRTRFLATPKMPSYLLVLAAGELERSSLSSDGVELGVVTTEGKQAGAAWPLQASAQLLGYFNQYFGVPYALPKLDHIAVPNGFGGAMENWGGIIYSENTFLFDPKKDPESAKRGVFAITAHEMAHQWFGNLVTMGWWDNLWLNEGFATWMASKASDHFNPEWHVWLAEHSDKEAALELDALQNTHPIQQAVGNESEANDAFDGITYAKGQAFLRMLEQYLGEDVFQAGIRAYLKKHQYSNTTSADLWAALQQASGKPVAQLAQSWIMQSGFPLISVNQQCVNGQRQIELTQQQFREQGAATRRLWSIPLQLQLGSSAPETVVMSAASLKLTRPGCDGMLLLDPQDIGFFRVQYAPALLEQLQAQWSKLPDSARLKLMSDTWALVRGGQMPLARYMGLVRQLGQVAPGEQPRLALWEHALDTLAGMNQFARTQSWYPAWQKHWHQLLLPGFEKLTWAEKSGESSEQRQLRARFISAMAELDQPTFVAEGQALFTRWHKDPANLALSIQEPVINLAARHANPATWAQIKKLAQESLSSSEKSRYYTALSLCKEPQLAQQTLALLLDPKLPPLTFSTLLYSVAANEHLDLAWQFVQKNHTALLASQTVRDRNKLVPNVLANASDVRYATEMLAFVKAKLPPEAMLEAERTLESIRIRARRKAALLPQMQAELN